MNELESLITDEEREQARKQTITVLKNKFLQYKAEYLSAQALGDVASKKRAADLQKKMEECEISYQAIKEGL